MPKRDSAKDVVQITDQEKQDNTTATRPLRRSTRKRAAKEGDDSHHSKISRLETEDTSATNDAQAELDHSTQTNAEGSISAVTSSIQASTVNAQVTNLTETSSQDIEQPALQTTAQTATVVLPSLEKLKAQMLTSLSTPMKNTQCLKKIATLTETPFSVLKSVFVNELIECFSLKNPNVKLHPSVENKVLLNSIVFFLAELAGFIHSDATVALQQTNMRNQLALGLEKMCNSQSSRPNHHKTSHTSFQLKFKAIIIALQQYLHPISLFVTDEKNITKLLQVIVNLLKPTKLEELKDFIKHCQTVLTEMKQGVLTSPNRETRNPVATSSSSKAPKRQPAASDEVEEAPAITMTDDVSKSGRKRKKKSFSETVYVTELNEEDLTEDPEETMDYADDPEYRPEGDSTTKESEEQGEIPAETAKEQSVQPPVSEEELSLKITMQACLPLARQIINNNTSISYIQRGENTQQKQTLQNNFIDSIIDFSKTACNLTNPSLHPAANFETFQNAALLITELASFMVKLYNQYFPMHLNVYLNLQKAFEAGLNEIQRRLEKKRTSDLPSEVKEQISILVKKRDRIIENLSLYVAPVKNNNVEYTRRNKLFNQIITYIFHFAIIQPSELASCLQSALQVVQQIKTNKVVSATQTPTSTIDHTQDRSSPTANTLEDPDDDAISVPPVTPQTSALPAQHSSPTLTTTTTPRPSAQTTSAVMTVRSDRNAQETVCHGDTQLYDSIQKIVSETVNKMHQNSSEIIGYLSGALSVLPSLSRNLSPASSERLKEIHRLSSDYSNKNGFTPNNTLLNLGIFYGRLQEIFLRCSRGNTLQPLNTQLSTSQVSSAQQPLSLQHPILSQSRFYSQPPAQQGVQQADPPRVLIQPALQQQVSGTPGFFQNMSPSQAAVPVSNQLQTTASSAQTQPASTATTSTIPETPATSIAFGMT